MSNKPTYEELEKRVQVLEQAELKRKQTEEELAQIFSMSLDMICIADIKKATFLKVNPAFTEVLGYSEAELLGKPFSDFIHPEDIDATQAIVEQKLQRGAKVINFENRYQCKDGSYRWLSWVSHSNPEQGLTYAIARDITEWKQNEEALEKSKELLDTTGRMARVGGWELDADTSEVTWTQETYRIHEVPLDQQPPLQEAINYFHPEDRPRLEQAIKRALDLGEPYDMELRFITAKGKHLWTRTKCHPEIIDGKTVNLKGIFQDVTDRKHAEIHFNENLSFLQTLLNTIPNPLFYKNVKGEYLGVNRAFEEFYGKRREEIIGKTVYDMGPKHIADKHHEKDQELFQCPGRQTYEWKVTNAAAK